MLATEEPDHALHGGSNNCHLGRTAGEAAHEGVGDLDEEVSNAGALQEGTEDDEHHNELGADVDGGGQDTLLAVEQIPDGVVQLAPEGRIAQAPNQGVDNKECGHDQNGQAHAAAADLCQCQDADDADDDLIPGKVAALLDDIHGEDVKVHKRRGADQHTGNVIPGHVVDLLVALFCREDQETHKDDAGHEGGQTVLLQPAGEQGNADAEQGERGQNTVDCNSRLTLPDPDIGHQVLLQPAVKHHFTETLP